MFGNLPPPKEAVKAIHEAAASAKFNGYAPSAGYFEAKEAVAKYVSTEAVKVDEKVRIFSGNIRSIILILSRLPQSL